MVPGPHRRSTNQTATAASYVSCDNHRRHLGGMGLLKSATDLILLAQPCGPPCQAAQPDAEVRIWQWKPLPVPPLLTSPLPHPFLPSPHPKRVDYWRRLNLLSASTECAVAWHQAGRSGNLLPPAVEVPYGTFVISAPAVSVYPRHWAEQDWAFSNTEIQCFKLKLRGQSNQPQLLSSFILSPLYPLPPKL